jgi:hypothetical protein
MAGCALIALIVGAPLAKAQTPKPKAPAPLPKLGGDPPGTQVIEANLRSWFRQYANEDGDWDKLCVARAFGYRHEYDWTPGTTTAKKDDKKDEEKKDDKAKEAEKDPDSQINKPPSTSGPALDSRYAKRRDFKFLAAVDKDGDGKITKDEFEEWAHDYAVELASQHDLANKAAAAKLAQAALQAQQMQNNLQRQMQRRPPARRYQQQRPRGY